MAGDLHCHTRISDGSLGIEELIAIAKRRGLQTISVTDHDTTAGATRAVIIGKRQQLNVIHGVEFSAVDSQRGAKVNLLCYLCDVPDRLEGLCRRVGEGRRKAAQEMIRKVMRYYPIAPDIIVRCATGSTSIFPQHIMHALMDAGYADAICGELYQKLFSSEQGTALVEPDYPDIREVLELIHSSGGVAVLSKSASVDDGLVEELVSLGLDGVEAYYPGCTPEQTDALTAYAADNKLLVTGGSNFHGMYCPSPRPVGSISIEDDMIRALITYKDKLKKKNA